MFASIVGTVTLAPVPSSAGVIPWAYNAVFGPVGDARGSYTGPTYASYRTRRHAATTVAYVPASGGGCSTCNQSANYAPASYSSYYAPYNTGYAPYTTSYAPSYGYDGFYGNYSQTAYYGGGSSYGSSCCNSCSGCSTCNNGCSTCGSGGCSSCNNGVSYANFNGGSTCSNCSVNSAPMQSGPTPAGYGSNSSGYGSNPSGYGTNHNYGSNNVGAPIPDPNNSRDINARINELEHRLNEDEKFLRKQHKNDYQPEQYSRPSTYRERDETVPARRRNTTIDSANPDTYEPPIRGRNPAPAVDPLDDPQLRNKPDLAAPKPMDDSAGGKSNDGAVNFREDEPQTRRLQDRSTTQAIAPKQRMQIVTKQSKAMIAKSDKPVKTSSAKMADLAKN